MRLGLHTPKDPWRKTLVRRDAEVSNLLSPDGNLRQVKQARPYKSLQPIQNTMRLASRYKQGTAVWPGVQHLFADARDSRSANM